MNKSKLVPIIITLFMFLFALSACKSEDLSDVYEFDIISTVDDGLAIVWRGSKRSIIEISSGRIILPFDRYDRLEFSRLGDFAHVRCHDNGHAIIHIPSGDFRLPFSNHAHIRLQYNYTAIIDGITLICLETSHTLIPAGQVARITNAIGNIAHVTGFETTTYLDPSRYDEYCFRYCFHDEKTLYHCYYHCEVCTNCHYMFFWLQHVIDISSGEVLVPKRRDQEIELLPNDTAIVTINRTVSIIDPASGEVLVPPRRFHTINAHDNFAVVSRFNETGLISLENMELVIPLGKYTEIRPGLTETTAMVTLGDCWGIFCLETRTEIMPPGSYDFFQHLEGDIVLSSKHPIRNIYDLSTGQLLNSIEVNGSSRPDGGSCYSRFVLLSGVSAATQIIWDNRDHPTEFEIINLATGEVIATETGRGSDGAIGRLVFGVRGNQLPTYADGLFVIENELSWNHYERGLINARTGEIIIPVSEDSPEIRPLPGGFVTLRYPSERWIIVSTEYLRGKIHEE